MSDVTRNRLETGRVSPPGVARPGRDWIRHAGRGLGAAVTLLALAGGCDRKSGSAQSDETSQPAASRQTAAVAPAPSGPDWPAFHDGGPLLGDAAPIGPPLMHLRWTYHAGDATPDTAPATQSSGAPPSFEGSAVIASGLAIAGDRDGGLHAIEIATGKQRWLYTSDSGFSATPAIAKGLVLVGDEGGVFHAVGLDDGKKRWTFDTGSEIHSSSNVVGDRVVFGTDGADIYCLEVATGKKAWAAKAGDRINGAPAIGPADADGTRDVYVSGCDAQLRAIGLADGVQHYARDIGALCPGSPALPPGRIVIGTDGGKVVCLSPDGKTQLWTFNGVENQQMVYASPAVGDDTVVVGARDRNVYALDLKDGSLKWRFPTRGEVDSSAVLSGGRVYIGGKDKRLYVIDLKTGKELWSFAAARAILATPAIGGGVLVIGDTAGNLYCLEPTR